MIYADWLKDAARVADKAPNPTDIIVTASGFRIVARRGGLQSQKIVPFDEVEFCQANPLVAAVRDLNRQLA